MLMRDFHFFDTYGDWRRHLTVRVWGRPILRWLRELYAYALCRYGNPVSFSTHTRMTGSCYCNTGRTTSAYLSAFGVGFNIWLTRDRGPRPCLCNLASWDALPEWYQDEIEENGGIARVRELLAHRMEAANA